MCGIVGVVAPETRDVDAAAVAGMAETLVHRGPDERGLHVDERRRAVLGFRRLSIIDLAGGHRFATECDSETILHAYEELGEACVQRLRGMFAFAIWDARAGRLFAARDRLGIKPLYWTLLGDRLLFASEIKALLRHPLVRPELDEAALYHYLAFLAAPAPSTLFRGIQKLPAGHTLRYEGRGAPRIAQYWDAVVPTAAEQDEATFVARTRELLRPALVPAARSA